jgi:hypothetical protein
MTDDTKTMYSQTCIECSARAQASGDCQQWACPKCGRIQRVIQTPTIEAEEIGDSMETYQHISKMWKAVFEKTGRYPL